MFGQGKSLAPIPESEAELEEEEDEGDSEEKESRRESVVSTTRNKVEVVREENTTSKEEGALSNSNGWQAIPKPKGHSTLDYARWDSVEDDSSEDDEDGDSDESRPQYRFRVKTVGVRPVKWEKEKKNGVDRKKNMDGFLHHPDIVCEKALEST